MNSKELYRTVRFVMVIIWFRVQFVINLHEWIFQKAELHELLRRVQFQPFEKRVQINHKLNEKPYDYLLIFIHKKSFHRSDDLIADMK